MDSRSGAARIASYLKTLPDAPGVYRMLNAAGDVLYVGKAKSLKKRVSSYALRGGHNDRITRMIHETAEMLFVTTASETEALLLESNLIKQLKPRYNVSYRDDKSFPNILLRQDHPFPQLLKHRGARSAKGSYFGPFASAGAVTRTLNTLQRAFLLRSCSDSVFAARTRPCLLYQIKRCSAPCVGRVDEAAYRELVVETEDFLRGKSRNVQKRLVSEMTAASEALDFEAAARLRDRVKAMSQIQASQGINPATFAEADLFAAYSEGGQACIQVFFFRAGQNWGNRPYFPRLPEGMELPEMLGSFVGQFYDERPAPEPYFAFGSGAGGSTAGRGAFIARRIQSGSVQAPARRKARDHGARFDQCARTTGPPHGRKQRPAAIAGRRGGSLCAGGAARAASRFMTIPISRGRMRWAPLSWRGRMALTKASTANSTSSRRSLPPATITP